MILEFAKTTYDELLEEIVLFDEMGITPAQKLSGKLNSIRTATLSVRHKVINEGFTSQAEEITFFKLWKPKFIAHHQYELARFKLLTDQPQSDDTEIRNYWIRELNFLQQFRNKHQFFFQYFITESGELDTFYFLRNASPVNYFWTESFDYDQNFGTPGDALFSRFICDNWLNDFILTRLTMAGENQGMADIDLNWTGEKQNLIEIAYGFWLTGQLNNGNATLLQITKWLELTLHVDLGNVQKAFNNIRSRKRLSPTKYIDDMKAELLRKIEDDLA